MRAILNWRSACGALALLSWAGLLAGAGQQTLFPTPDDGVKALVSAAEAKDQAAMTAVLGPEREKLLSGDPVEDAAALNRFEDALDDLTHALDVDPGRAEALVLRAAAWRHIGQLDLAQDDVDRAIAIDPENAEAMLERGILRQRHHDVAGARGDWRRAIELAPDSATADLAEQNLALLEAGPARR